MAQAATTEPILRPLPDELVELMAECLALLSQPVRVRILGRLALEGEMTVQALADALGATQQNISRHLKLLHGGELVMRRRQGRLVWYGLADDWAPALLNNVGARMTERVRRPLHGDFLSPPRRGE